MENEVAALSIGSEAQAAIALDAEDQYVTDIADLSANHFSKSSVIEDSDALVSLVEMLIILDEIFKLIEERSQELLAERPKLIAFASLVKSRCAPDPVALNTLACLKVSWA